MRIVSEVELAAPASEGGNGREKDHQNYPSDVDVGSWQKMSFAPADYEPTNLVLRLGISSPISERRETESLGCLRMHNDWSLQTVNTIAKRR